MSIPLVVGLTEGTATKEDKLREGREVINELA